MDVKTEQTCSIAARAASLSFSICCRNSSSALNLSAASAALIWASILACSVKHRYNQNESNYSSHYPK
jgi:hypothetical protein